MAEIFLHINDAQHGPYTVEQLEVWLRDGTVSPDTPAWRVGMPDWMPLAMWGAEAAPVANSQFAPVPPMPQKGHGKGRHYHHPPGAGYVAPNVVPGIGRLQYVISTLLAWVIALAVAWLAIEFVILSAASKDVDKNTKELLLTGLGLGGIGAVVFLTALGFWLGAQRLLNIGWNAAFVLLMLVPLANFLLGLALVALPKGFARSRRLDGAAWIMVVVALTGVGMTTLFATTTDFVDNLETYFESLRRIKQPA
jgi:hypothetical protein